MTKTKDEVWDSFMGKGDFATLSVHQKSLVKGILGEYAKQQAIEFMKFVDAFYSQSVSDESYDKMYNQFIESQNK